MVDELDKIYPEFIGEWVKEGFSDKLVLIGFPYDLGARQAGQRQGADHGPDSFRRFLKMNNIGAMHNPEFDLSIGEHLKICDYGNIQIDNGEQSQQALIEKLATKVGLCLARTNIPFIIGGSRDLLQGVCQAQNSADVFLSISPTLDLEILPTPLLCHQSSTHSLLLGHGKQIIGFGVDGSRTSKNKLTYSGDQLKIVYMNTVRKQSFTKVWEETLATLKANTSQKIHLCFNIESVENAIGVSANCTNGGLKTEEAIQIMFDAGYELAGQLVSVDLSEYNPCVEDWRTGRLAVTLFYYFALGLAKAIAQQKV